LSRRIAGIRKGFEMVEILTGAAILLVLALVMFLVSRYRGWKHEIMERGEEGFREDVTN